MDLRAYYQKIRNVEAKIAEPVVVIVSRETPEGGKAGVKTEVPRELAARLLVEEKADLATPEDAAQFREKVQAKQRIAQEISTYHARPLRKG